MSKEDDEDEKRRKAAEAVAAAQQRTERLVPAAPKTYAPQTRGLTTLHTNVAQGVGAAQNYQEAITQFSNSKDKSFDTVSSVTDPKTGITTTVYVHPDLSDEEKKKPENHITYTTDTAGKLTVNIGKGVKNAQLPPQEREGGGFEMISVNDKGVAHYSADKGQGACTTVVKVDQKALAAEELRKNAPQNVSVVEAKTVAQPQRPEQPQSQPQQQQTVVVQGIPIQPQPQPQQQMMAVQGIPIQRQPQPQQQQTRAAQYLQPIQPPQKFSPLERIGKAIEGVASIAAAAVIDGVCFGVVTVIQYCSFSAVAIDVQRSPLWSSGARQCKAAAAGVDSAQQKQYESAMRASNSAASMQTALRNTTSRGQIYSSATIQSVNRARGGSVVGDNNRSGTAPQSIRAAGHGHGQNDTPQK